MNLKLSTLAFLALTLPAFADQGIINPTTSFMIGANPSSTLQMTSATTAYSAGQLIATSATAGSVVVPSVTMPKPVSFVPRLRLYINDATSTAWGSATIQIDLWSAAPTFTNGDRAAFAVATGTAGHLGAYTCTMSAEYGDGVYGECAPVTGVTPVYALNAAPIYWTAQAVTASGVTGASKVMTLVVETVE